MYISPYTTITEQYVQIPLSGSSMPHKRTPDLSRSILGPSSSFAPSSKGAGSSESDPLGPDPRAEGCWLNSQMGLASPWRQLCSSQPAGGNTLA